MSTSYHIDMDLGVVYSTASGIVTDQELIEHQSALIKDPEFRPNMRQLLDTRAVSEIQVTPEGVRTIASHNPWRKGARRALVALNETAYGLGRMFELGRAHAEDEFRVFRTMDEARAWLGLPPEP